MDGLYENGSAQFHLILCIVYNCPLAIFHSAIHSGINQWRSLFLICFFLLFSKFKSYLWIHAISYYFGQTELTHSGRRLGTERIVAKRIYVNACAPAERKDEHIQAKQKWKHARRVCAREGEKQPNGRMDGTMWKTARIVATLCTKMVYGHFQWFIAFRRSSSSFAFSLVCFPCDVDTDSNECVQRYGERCLAAHKESEPFV